MYPDGSPTTATAGAGATTTARGAGATTTARGGGATTTVVRAGHPVDNSLSTNHCGVERHDESHQRHQREEPIGSRVHFVPPFASLAFASSTRHHDDLLGVPRVDRRRRLDSSSVAARFQLREIDRQLRASFAILERGDELPRQVIGDRQSTRRRRQSLPSA